MQMSPRKAAGDFFEQGGRGLQSSALREANRRAVLTYLFLEPGSSMADISRLTGLAPQTTSAILVELEDEKLVKRGEPLRGRRGQPATPVFIDPNNTLTVGVELSWHHLEVVVLNIGLEVLGRYRRSFPFPDARTVTAEIVSAVNELKTTLSAEQQSRLIAIGIAMPSALDQNLPLLGAPPEQVALWQNLDLPASIERETQLPTECYFGGNAAAWAELVSYRAPRPTSFAYLFVGTFLAGSIVSQSTIWEGLTGEAACFGSMLVAGENNALVAAQQVASVTALARMLRDKGIAVPHEDPADWPWADWGNDLLPWLEKAAQANATVILNATAAVGCDHVIMDGVLPVALMTQLVDETRRQLETLENGDIARPSISQGHLGSSASALGAAELPVFRRYFSREVLA